MALEELKAPLKPMSSSSKERLVWCYLKQFGVSGSSPCTTEKEVDNVIGNQSV